MKAAYFTALRRVEVADAPEPKLQSPEDALIAIDRVGVCGSDVHYYLEGRIGDQVLRYPATLGHECSGTVLAAGPAVKHLAAGDRVAVDPAFPCRACDQCLAGRFHTCRKLLFMGMPGQAPARWPSARSFRRRAASRFPARSRSMRPCLPSRSRWRCTRCGSRSWPRA